MAESWVYSWVERNRSPSELAQQFRRKKVELALSRHRLLPLLTDQTREKNQLCLIHYKALKHLTLYGGEGGSKCMFVFLGAWAKREIFSIPWLCMPLNRPNAFRICNVKWANHTALLVGQGPNRREFINRRFFRPFSGALSEISSVSVPSFFSRKRKRAKCAWFVTTA